MDRDRFAAYSSPGGAPFMAAWWNRMPQYGPAQIHLDSYGVQFWSLEPMHWRALLVGGRTHPTTGK